MIKMSLPENDYKSDELIKMIKFTFMLQGVLLDVILLAFWIGSF